MQQGNNVYLGARWYDPRSATFISRDPFEGYAEQPYSTHPYQYGYANPVLNTDPSGKCIGPVYALCLNIQQAATTLIGGSVGSSSNQATQAAANRAVERAVNQAVEEITKQFQDSYTRSLAMASLFTLLVQLGVSEFFPNHTGNTPPSLPPPLGGTSLHPQTIDDWYHGTPLIGIGAFCPVNSFPLQPEVGPQYTGVPLREQGPIVLEASASTILRQNLGAVCIKHTQAHHIIPSELVGLPFVQRAIRAGWDNNGAPNGILLADNANDGIRRGLPFHNGRHRVYNDTVRAVLDDLETEAFTQHWSDAEALLQLTLLKDSLKQTILNLGGGVRIH